MAVTPPNNGTTQLPAGGYVNGDDYAPPPPKDSGAPDTLTSVSKGDSPVTPTIARIPSGDGDPGADTPQAAAPQPPIVAHRKRHPSLLRRLEKGVLAIPHALGGAIEAVGHSIRQNTRVGDKYENVALEAPPEHFLSDERAVVPLQEIPDFRMAPLPDFTVPPAKGAHQHAGAGHHHLKKDSAAKAATAAAQKAAADAKAYAGQAAADAQRAHADAERAAGLAKQVQIHELTGDGPRADQARATELSRITGAHVSLRVVGAPLIDALNKDTLFVEVPKGVDAKKYREGFNRILHEAVPHAAQVEGLKTVDGKQGFYLTHFTDDGVIKSLHAASAWTNLGFKQGEFANLTQSTTILSARQAVDNLTHTIPPGSHVAASKANDQLTITTPGIRDPHSDRLGAQVAARLGTDGNVTYTRDDKGTTTRTVTVPFDKFNTVGDMQRIQSAFNLQAPVNKLAAAGP